MSVPPVTEGAVGQPVPGPPAPAGLIVLDKPPGHTSHDCVARCRRLLATRKVGHAGTLDPDATGILLIGAGKATKTLRFLQSLPKRYQARVCFGVETDTLDASGRVLARREMPITAEELEGALEELRGRIRQAPPMFSAVKVDGERLYVKARRGEEIEREPREVEVFALCVESFHSGPYPEAVIDVECSSGTYVRSLAAEMGRKLGGFAHLGDLRRTAVGPFAEAGAHSFAELEDLSTRGELSKAVIPLEECLPHLPRIRVDEALAEGVRHGAVFPSAILLGAGPGDDGEAQGSRSIWARQSSTTRGKALSEPRRVIDSPVAVYGPDSKLIAVYGPHKRSAAKPLCVLSD